MTHAPTSSQYADLVAGFQAHKLMHFHSFDNDSDASSTECNDALKFQGCCSSSGNVFRILRFSESMKQYAIDVCNAAWVEYFKLIAMMLCESFARTGHEILRPKVSLSFYYGNGSL